MVVNRGLIFVDGTFVPVYMRLFIRLLLYEERPTFLKTSSSFSSPFIPSPPLRPTVRFCDDDTPYLSISRGNNEAQYYRSENIQVSNGTMKIIAMKEDYQGFGFTSGRIRSLNQVEIDLTKPTYIEGRIQIPNGGQGLWPAFWMLPTPVVTWPTGGEIDMMEFIGREPHLGQGYMHYGDAFGDKGQRGGPMKFSHEPAYERFHTFGLLKTTNRIAYLIDGYEYQSYTSTEIDPKYTWPFENTFHFILNLAVGGFWPGYPDETTTFPTTLEVDYVRVYNYTDDMTAMTAFPTITGNRLLHMNTTQVEYCVQNLPSDASIEWEAPTGASFSASTTANCILVNFGISSGYVRAIVTTSCATTDGKYELSIPVEIQPYYGIISTLWDSTITPTLSKGTLELTSSSEEQLQDDGNPVWKYTRNSLELYDHIQLDFPTAISNPEEFFTGEKKFFFTIKTTTSAACTQIMLQLEDQFQSIPDNYPIGRHSRFQCLLEPTREWQRVACDFIDQPDLSVTNVNRLRSLSTRPWPGRIFTILDLSTSLLLVVLVLRPIVNFFNRMDQGTLNCRRAAKSEEGACQDGGFNNDWEGYNGNLVNDCDDPACYMIDPACGGTPTTSSPTVTPVSSPTFMTTPSLPSEPTSISSPPFEIIPTPEFDGVAECSLNEACVGLDGDCCPTSAGIFLCKFVTVVLLPRGLGWGRKVTVVIVQHHWREKKPKGAHHPPTSNAFLFPLYSLLL